MNVTPQHTATPYEVAGEYIRTARREGDMRGLSIARMDLANPSREADAAFIVKTCNGHDKIVEVLKAIRDLLLEDRNIPLVLVEAALVEAGEPI